MSKLHSNSDFYSKEYETLTHELLQAKLEKNLSGYKTIESRLNKLDDAIWDKKYSIFPELRNYQTFYEALRDTALRKGLSFPLIEYSRKYRFGLILSKDLHAINILLKERDKSYIVLVSPGDDEKVEYGGITNSLEQVSMVLSRWCVDLCAMEILLKEFGWLSKSSVNKEKTDEIMVKGDKQAKIFCLEIAKEMSKLFDISLAEAVGRINKHWDVENFVGPQMIYHRDPEWWAYTIYYEAGTFWWIEKWMAEHTPKPKPYP